MSSPIKFHSGFPWSEIKNYLSFSPEHSILTFDNTGVNWPFNDSYNNLYKLWQRFEKQKSSYVFMQVSSKTTNCEWIVIKQEKYTNFNLSSLEYISIAEIVSGRYSGYYWRDTLIHSSAISKYEQVFSVESEHGNRNNNFKEKGKMINLVDKQVDFSFNLPCIQYVNFDGVTDSGDIPSDIKYGGYQFLLSSQRADEITKILWPYCFLPNVIIRLVLEFGWAPIIQVGKFEIRTIQDGN